MVKLMKYLGVAALTALPGILTIGVNVMPSKNPQCRASGSPDLMLWSFPGEYQGRNFFDERPFSNSEMASLDKVILRDYDGSVFTLNPGDEGFREQEQVYKEKIVIPYLAK
ncbi:MAG: hypothetical protein ABIF88_03270 [archaeon]